MAQGSRTKPSANIGIVQKNLCYLRSLEDLFHFTIFIKVIVYRAKP